MGKTAHDWRAGTDNLPSISPPKTTAGNGRYMEKFVNQRECVEKKQLFYQHYAAIINIDVKSCYFHHIIRIISMLFTSVIRSMFALNNHNLINHITSL